MVRPAKAKPVRLEDLQREMVMLANAMETTTEVWKLRLAINRVLDAYQNEAAKAFGLGILVGAGGMLVLLFAH